MSHSKMTIVKGVKSKIATNVSQGLSEPNNKLHQITRNTQLIINKIIKKVSTAKNSKVLPSDYLSIINSFHRGRIICHQADCFHVSVSESLVNRAISFLDKLVKELEIRAFKIRSHQDKSGHYVVAIKENESISFQISEGYKYYPIEQDPDSRSALEKLLYRDKEPIPTGKLTFSVLARETYIGKNWTDGKRLIEAELPAIIEEFESIVPRQKQRRAESAINDEKLNERIRVFKEAESKRYAEQAIYDNSMHEAQAFKAYRELELYLDHLEGQCLKEYGNINVDIQSWIATARQLAQSQNPVNKRLQLLKKL